MKKITIKLAGYRLGIIVSIILAITTIGRTQSSYSFNELIIRFQSGTSTSYIDSLRQEYNAVEDFTISPSPVSDVHLWRITQFPAGGNNDLNDINEVNNNARGRAKVKSVGLNYDSKVFSFNHDDDFETEIPNPTYLCPEKFSITCDVGNSITKIAILDTGVGYDLGENNIPVFYSPAIFDPFYGNYIGYDFANQTSDPQDDHGHGTHIAGIIAEIAAIAQANTIQLESFKTHDETGTGKIFDIILAVDQSILNGVNIINMSFSYQAPPPSTKVEPLEFVIDLAGGYGILVVAAAGNDREDNDAIAAPSYPASFTCGNIITVALANCEQGMSTFSNWGNQSVDIATLGENIIAPDHTGAIVAKSGTSQATAITSGVAGLLATNLISIDWNPIKCSIIDGAEYTPSLDSLMGTEGIVDANNAFLELMIQDCGLGYRNDSMAEEEIKSDFDQISVYPNPFDEYCTIKYNMKTANKVVVNIYDEIGQLIFNTQQHLNAGTYMFKWFPDKAVPAGMYFIQIQTDNEVVIQKVAKHR